jgi:hypothetical protein
VPAHHEALGCDAADAHVVAQERPHAELETERAHGDRRGALGVVDHDVAQDHVAEHVAVDAADAHVADEDLVERALGLHAHALATPVGAQDDQAGERHERGERHRAEHDAQHHAPDPTSSAAHQNASPRLRW